MQVQRTGNSLKGDVAVEVKAFEEAAEVGSDFAAMQTIVEWQDGEGGAKNIEIPIYQNLYPEDDEIFTVKLLGTAGGVYKINPSETTVKILGDLIGDEGS